MGVTPIFWEVLFLHCKFTLTPLLMDSGGATFLEILSLYFELFKVKYSPPLWEGWSIARNGKMKKLGVCYISNFLRRMEKKDKKLGGFLFSPYCDILFG